MTLGLSVPELHTLMLISVRIIGFLVVAPPFSYRAFPATVRMMLALGIALAIYGNWHNTLATLDPGQFLFALFIEAFVGGLFGFLVYLVFTAVQVAGSLLDQMGGFAMASAFDPLNLTQNTPVARLFQMTTLGLLFASNGHHVILAGIMKTFDAIALGAGIPFSWLADTATQHLSYMFVVAVQIAGPLLIILFLADVGLGLLTRVAPALNAFAMGFPLKIYLTLALGALVYLTLPGVMSTLLHHTSTTTFGGL